MVVWRTGLAALAVGLGLSGQVGSAAAEGTPPRVVLVQTAGVGPDRQTTVVSSNNPTTRVVPSQGVVTGGRQPEAVLGEQAARPAPVVGSAEGSPAGWAVPATSAGPPRETAPSGLAPAQLRCVQDALGRAAQSGLISRDRPSIGGVQIGWIAGQCDLDPADLAPVLAHALGQPGPAEAAARSDSQPPAAESAQRPSWQRSILDQPDASPRERLQTMRAASAPGPTEERLLPLWQLALLGLTGLIGLAGSLYGLSWLARPRYVVRLVQPPRRAVAETARSRPPRSTPIPITHHPRTRPAPTAVRA
jgi:hypothetical protein